MAQILLGDPQFESSDQHILEDHIVQFLSQQPERDPAALAKVVQDHLGEELSLKQRVQLSMVMDGYWTAAAGFYERVIEHAPVESLKALARDTGLAGVMDSLTR